MDLKTKTIPLKIVRYKDWSEDEWKKLTLSKKAHEKAKNY